MKNQTGSMKDYINEDIADKVFIFRSLNLNNNPSIIDAEGKPLRALNVESHDAVSHVTYKDSDGRMRERVARYIQGEQSIWKEEQSPDDKIPKKKFKIVFLKGIKRVEGTEATLLKYMMVDNLNASNPNRKKSVRAQYELVDNTKSIETAMNNDILKSEAINFAYKGDWDAVQAYARVLNVNLNQKVDEVRWDLKRIAEANPVKFMDDLKKPSTKKKALVLKAIDMGYLVTNHTNNSIAWSNNPYNPLDIAAQGRDIIDSFVNKLSTEDGKLIQNAIQDMVNPAPVSESKMIIPTKEEIDEMKSNINPIKPMLSAPNESDKELIELTENAIKLGVVTLDGKMPWLDYKGEKFRQIKGFVVALKSNEGMLEVLKRDIAKTFK
jgi:hypothetical protein